MKERGINYAEMENKFTEAGIHIVKNIAVDDLGPLVDKQFLMAAVVLNDMINI